MGGGGGGGGGEGVSVCFCLLDLLCVHISSVAYVIIVFVYCVALWEECPIAMCC